MVVVVMIMVVMVVAMMVVIMVVMVMIAIRAADIVVMAVLEEMRVVFEIPFQI
jgi:hypothetical protein